jgi:hypothetical protein
MMQFNDSMYMEKLDLGEAIDIKKFKSDFETWQTTVLNGLRDFKDELNSFGSDIKFGQDVTDALGGDEFVESLNKMAIATGMSAEQMNSMLSSIGV